MANSALDVNGEQRQIGSFVMDASDAPSGVVLDANRSCGLVECLKTGSDTTLLVLGKRSFELTLHACRREDSECPFTLQTRFPSKT